MQDFGISDLVKISGKDFEYTGIVMPVEDDSIIVLKLENGYNVGILKNKVSKHQLINRAKQTAFNISKLKLKLNLPKITIISTGGTITSRVDYKTGGVYSLSNPSELLVSIPEINKLANIKLVTPFNVMSEDMTFKEWQELASIVSRELKTAEGVIITHGTDTLHFTSAALSFMLKDLSKPVAVVGGQRSSDRGSFDGAQNLICAVHYCLSNIAEVSIVMHGTESDSYCLANRGTKVRKMHTSRRDAFRPINELPLAKIWPDGKIEIINKHYKKRSKNVTNLDSKFDDKVALLKVYPGASPDFIDYLIDKGYKGIILEATAFGHIPTQPQNKDGSWIPKIKRAIKNDVFVGITSQCLYGSTNSDVYSNLRILKKAGAVYLKDMLPETAFVKLGWVLGHTKQSVKIKEEMLKNYAREMNNRIEKKSFLY